MEYLKSHYQEDISLDLLADRYYLNPSYLSRMFKQCLGTGLTDYLIELRMENAKKLLLTGKYKVYEISQKVGYKSDKLLFSGYLRAILDSHHWNFAEVMWKKAKKKKKDWKKHHLANVAGLSI